MPTDKALDQAVNWVLDGDEVTVFEIWSAADRAKITTKQLTEALRARNIINDAGVEHVKKMSGKGWDRIEGQGSKKS